MGTLEEKSKQKSSSHVNHTVTILARHAHWCNSGMSALVVTSYFLVGFNAFPLQRWNSYLVSLTRHQTHDLLGKSPRQEPDTIILLNGHSNKLSSKFLSFFPYNRASLSSHKRSFDRSRWQLIQRPTTGQCAENKRLWSPRVQMGYLKYTPLQAQGTSNKSGL